MKVYAPTNYTVEYNSTDEYYFVQSTATGTFADYIYLSDAENYEAARITGASVTVGQDLTVKYYVTPFDPAAIVDLSKLSMRFTFDDDETVVTKYTEINGEYVFSFKGISPQRMSDIIKAELLYDGKVIASKDAYSVKENLTSLLGKTASKLGLTDAKKAELDQLIVDILYYGAAAQNYKNYNLENLANADLDESYTPSSTLPTESENVKNVTTHVETLGDVYLTAATVWFDNVNKIGIKLSTAENVKLVVKIGDDTVGTTYENLSSAVFFTDAISATGFDTVYTFEIYEGDTKVQTLTYSVSSYVYAMMNKTEKNSEELTEMAELARALYRYGTSAVAYQTIQTESAE